MKTLIATSPKSQSPPLCTVEQDRPGHILYAGQLLAATFVSEINLCRSEGMDTMVRDQAGRYYLHREVYKDHHGESLPGDTPWKERCREHSHHSLHRLSHAAMALWMIETSGGNRQVRRDAASLWQQHSRPAKPVTPLVETMPLVPLGPQASRTLASLCRRFRVERECVLRSVVEQFLADSLQDDSLAPCVAGEARVIKRKGHVPEHWWTNAELKGRRFQTKEAA